MTIGITTSTGIRLGVASRGMRFVARMIDGSVASAPGLALGIWARFMGAPIAPLTTLASLWAAFYFLFGDAFPGGQSFAKRWLGMRVVDEDTGAPCTWGESFTRNITWMLLGPIDGLFIFGERHQRLGDKIVSTIVVTAD
jgi:uncharacterized RDD family membrane protein YckC